MTLLQQFADSVTGLSLPPQFRLIRIKLTAFVFVFLSLVLLLSGFNVYDTSRQGLENFRNQINELITKNYHLKLYISNLFALQIIQ